MAKPYPYDLMEAPRQLAELGEWSEAVYLDMIALREGRMAEEEFWAKYGAKVAILCLDMTGFTQAAIQYGEVNSLLRIFDVQRVCVPIFQDYGARLVHAFADDLTALFDDPNKALDSALEIHRRIRIFNESDNCTENPADCCIGIGFGDVLAIGPNLAMGDEMNRASKLGEDTARAYEILITGNTYEAVKHREDCEFKVQNKNDLPFPYYEVCFRNP